MSSRSAANGPNAFEIKSATLPLVSFIVKNPDLARLAQDLEARLGATPDFFDGDAVVIDLSALEATAGPVDLSGLTQLLRRYRMNPVAARATHPAHLATAELAGLFVANDARPKAELPGAATVQTVVQEVVREVVREVPAASEGAMVIDKPLRSGQHVYARGRDLVLLAMVNPGAEVMADGSIHVYAPLRGKAIAGAKGQTQARIFTQSLEAELVSIAGVYRTSETALPEQVNGRAAQIFLRDDKLVMQPL